MTVSTTTRILIFEGALKESSLMKISEESFNYTLWSKVFSENFAFMRTMKIASRTTPSTAQTTIILKTYD
jgi:hypothetical protein